jgi:hypothetical protein
VKPVAEKKQLKRREGEGSWNTLRDNFGIAKGAAGHVLQGFGVPLACDRLHSSRKPAGAFLSEAKQLGGTLAAVLSSAMGITVGVLIPNTTSSGSAFIHPRNMPN